MEMDPTNNSINMGDQAATRTFENTQKPDDYSRKDNREDFGSHPPPVPVGSGQPCSVHDEGAMTPTPDDEALEQKSESGDSDETVKHFPALAIPHEDVGSESPRNDSSLFHPPNLPGDMSNVPPAFVKWMVETHDYLMVFQENFEELRKIYRALKSCQCTKQMEGPEPKEAEGNAGIGANDWDRRAAGDSWTVPNEWVETDHNITNDPEAGRQKDNNHALSNDDYGNINDDEKNLSKVLEASFETEKKRDAPEGQSTTGHDSDGTNPKPAEKFNSEPHLHGPPKTFSSAKKEATNVTEARITHRHEQSKRRTNGMRTNLTRDEHKDGGAISHDDESSESLVECQTPEKHYPRKVPQHRRTEKQEQRYWQKYRTAQWAQWVRNHMDLSFEDMREEMRKKNGNEQEIVKALEERGEEWKTWVRDNFMEFSDVGMKKHMRASHAREQEIVAALKERTQGWKRWVKEHSELSVKDFMKKIMEARGVTAEEIEDALVEDRRGG